MSTPPPYPQTLFPLQFKRQQNYPIDVDTVFYTTADRTAYLSSPRRYAGMLVVDSEQNKAYLLNDSRNAWIPVGSGDSPVRYNAERDVIEYFSSEVNEWVDIAAPKIKTITTDYTLTIKDNQYIIRTNSTADINLIVPTDAQVALPIGTTCVLSQNGTGGASFVAASGVTIDSPGTLTIAMRYGKASLTKTAANKWEVEGNIGQRINLSQLVVSSNITLGATDVGKSIVHLATDSSARTVTIPSNAVTAFTVETVFPFTVESGSGPLTIQVTSDTLYQAGVGAVTSYTVQPGFTAEIRKIKSTLWLLTIFGPRGLEVIANDNAITTDDSMSGKLIYRSAGSAGISLHDTAKVGTTIHGINDGSAFNIVVTSGTLVLAGSGIKSSVACAQYAWWTAEKVTSTRWYITGPGLS